MQEIGAKVLQTVYRSVQQRPHNWLGGLVPGQGVQISLDRGSWCVRQRS